MNNVFLFLVLVSSVICVNAQDIERVKSTKEVTWYGLDFTQARMIGSESNDFTNTKAIINNHFENWNLLFINEAHKYDIERAFRKKVLNKISVSADLNKKVDPTTLVTYDHNRLNTKNISQIAAQYKTEDDGIGLCFAIENFEAVKRLIRFYVVFFDQKTGDVLLSEYVEAKSYSGVGFKNIWAGSFYYAMRSIRKEYPDWVKTDKKAMKKAKKASESKT